MTEAGFAELEAWLLGDTTITIDPKVAIRDLLAHIAFIQPELKRAADALAAIADIVLRV